MDTIITISIIIATITWGFLLVFTIYYNLYHILKQESSSSKAHCKPFIGGILGATLSAVVPDVKSLYPDEIRKRNKTLRK